MRKHYLSRLARIFALTMSFAMLSPFAVNAEEAGGESGPAQNNLQLVVSINGQSSNMVAGFTDLGDGRFAAKASELTELGIQAPPGAQPGDIVPLDSYAGLSYVYDEAKQTIALETVDQNRITKNFDARGELNQVSVTPSDYGAVLNYTLFGTSGETDASLSQLSGVGFSGVNATLDARLIAPLGVLDQSAIIGMTLADETQTLRLNTTYTFTDDENLVRWRAGDLVSGGTGWSRPVRLGGIQAQREFSVRPDLVKTPLPSVSGSAAVPSAVDVYIDGVKSYSKEVPAGPYQIDNIPSISGSGVAQVVTRDASGRETIQSLSFYNSPQLLKPGLSDFSVELGYARSHYGIELFGYGDALLGSGTLRLGITDWLTAEAHGEGGDGLINFGAGLVARAFDLGVVSAAVSTSSSRLGTGTQLYGSFETTAGPLAISGRAQHALDDYEDLASLTARENNLLITSNGGGLPLIASGLFSYAPPRSVDSLTLSMPIAFDKSTISATLLRYESVNSEPTELATASYSRPLTAKASMNATGYIDINDTSKAGLYVGVSMSLDNNISLSAGVSGRGAGDYTGNLSLNKPVSHEPGSWGWRINDLEGDSPYRNASVGYRGTAARVEAGLTQGTSGVHASASVDGAVAVLGGNVYAANHIDDSFAVVDAHAPGVKVQRENLLIGTTNEDGKILIPNLNSYHRNKISIDPMDLPINAEPATTYDYVTPGYRSGVYVNFDVKKATPNAVVILKMPDGSFVAAGSEGHLDGSDEPFVVGYDGQAFIRDLKAVNTIHVTLANGQCSATFASDQSAEVQPTIGPEICQ